MPVTFFLQLAVSRTIIEFQNHQANLVLFCESLQRLLAGCCRQPFWQQAIMSKPGGGDEASVRQDTERSIAYTCHQSVQNH
jgi:hypothetical protein